LIVDLHKLTVQGGVMSALHQELMMRTTLDNPPLIQHEDNIRMPNRAETMGDH
jgi:hypothetical protein